MQNVSVPEGRRNKARSERSKLRVLTGPNKNQPRNGATERLDADHTSNPDPGNRIHFTSQLIAASLAAGGATGVSAARPEARQLQLELRTNKTRAAAARS